MPWSQEPVSILSYMAKGILQICLRLWTLTWRTYSRLIRWAQPNPMIPKNWRTFPDWGQRPRLEGDVTKKEWSQRCNGVAFEDRERGPLAKKMWVNSGSQRRQGNGFSPTASREALMTVSGFSLRKCNTAHSCCWTITVWSFGFLSMKIEASRSYKQWETAENQYVQPRISSRSLCLHFPLYPEVQNCLWKLRNGVQVRLGETKRVEMTKILKNPS